MSWVAVGVGGAALIGGAVSADASKKAAGTQAGAADKATQAQLQMFNQTQSNLSPWMQGGQASLQALMKGAGLEGPPQMDWNKYLQDNPDVAANSYYSKNPQQHYTDHGQSEGRTVSMLDQSQVAPDMKFGSLIKPFGMEDFQESPAYQFNLQQGQQALNKAAAARGKYYAPGTLQDLSKFSQGLASNEFQNAYQNYNTNMGNIWNRLSTLSGSGQNAAANLGTNASQVAGQVGNNIMGAGNAQAAGTVGAANAINGGLGSAYNAYLTQQILGGNQQSTIGPVQEMAPGQFSTVNPQYGN